MMAVKLTSVSSPTTLNEMYCYNPHNNNWYHTFTPIRSNIFALPLKKDVICLGCNFKLGWKKNLFNPPINQN